MYFGAHNTDRLGENNSNRKFRNLKYLELVAAVSNPKHIFSYVQNVVKIQFLNIDCIGNLISY